MGSIRVVGSESLVHLRREMTFMGQTDVCFYMNNGGERRSLMKGERISSGDRNKCLDSPGGANDTGKAGGGISLL